jgi:CheY-like chemotaxis protein
LRAGPQGAILYLIAISGYGDAQARERGREAGFDLYLVKPVEPEELKRVLAKAHNTH